MFTFKKLALRLMGVGGLACGLMLGSAPRPVVAQHISNTERLMNQMATLEQHADAGRILTEQRSQAAMLQQQIWSLRASQDSANYAQQDQVELQNKLLRWKRENPYGEAYLYGNGKVWLEPDHYLYYNHP